MKKGFTLVEMLVAIAIIVIIAAMLIPAIKIARANGRRVDIQRSEAWYGVGHSVYIKSLSVTGVVNELMVGFNTTNVNLLVTGTNNVPVQMNNVDVRLLGEVIKLEN